MELNKHFKEFFNNDNRYTVLSGGAGAGKSVAAAQKILYRCLSETDKKHPHKFLIIRKSYNTNTVSTYQLLVDLIYKEPGLTSVCVIKKNPLEIQFFNGNKIIFGGLDDSNEIEKIKSIANITSIWIEEANQITLEGFKQLDLRVRGDTPYYKQIILTFNPVSVYNWVYDYFYNSPTTFVIDNRYLLKSTYLDNPFIDEPYKKQLDSYKQIDINYYNIYCLGEWGSTENLIYKPFKEYNDIIITKETIWGIDFGFNHPAVLLQIDCNDGKYYITERIYESGLTRAEFFDKVQSIIFNKRDNIYADSAEPQSIEDLKRRGLNVMQADKSVKDGINYIKSIYNNIYTKSSNYNFNKENILYTYKLINGKITDEPIKINDDAMDALRYAIYTHNKKQPITYGFIRSKQLF